MYNAERSMENRRSAGVASRAAYRGRGGSSDYAEQLQPDEDPNHDLWRRRASRAQQEVKLQLTPEMFDELSDQLTTAAENMTWYQQCRGWMVLADEMKLVAYGRASGPTVHGMVEAWTIAAKMATF